MAATTILRTRTRFRPPKIRLHCRLSKPPPNHAPGDKRNDRERKPSRKRRPWWTRRIQMDNYSEKYRLLVSKNSIGLCRSFQKVKKALFIIFWRLFACMSVLVCTLTKKIHGNFHVPLCMLSAWRYMEISVLLSCYLRKGTWKFLCSSPCYIARQGTWKFPCSFPCYPRKARYVEISKYLLTYVCKSF